MSSKVSKKALKFTKLIASQLKDQYQDGCDKELKMSFKEAVKDLSKNEIKSEIQGNIEKYLGKFVKFLKMKDGHGKLDSFPYNLYLKGSSSKPPRTISQQQDSCVWNYVAKQVESDPSLMNMLDGFVVESAKFPTLSKCYQLIRLTCGSNNNETLRQIMLKYYKEVVSLDEEARDKGVERCRDLAKEIKGFISICHLRKQDCHEVDEKSPSYADILASLLSIYTDLLSIALRSKPLEKNDSKMLCNFVMYVLPWQYQQLDILLQLSSVTKDDTDFIIPLWSAIFKWNVDKKKDKKYYLKYVLAVQALREKFGDAVDSLVQSTKAIPAPKDFLSWLKEENSELVEEFPDDKGFKKRTITKFLLDDITKDQTDRMLDIFTCDVTNLEDEIPNENSLTQHSDEDEEENIEDKEKGLIGGLFFIDKGSTSKRKDSDHYESLTFEAKSGEEVENLVFEEEDDEKEEFVIDTSKFDKENMDTDTEIFIPDISKKTSDNEKLKPVKKTPRKHVNNEDNESCFRNLQQVTDSPQKMNTDDSENVQDRLNFSKQTISNLDSEKLSKGTPEINKKRRKSLRKTSENETDKPEPTEKSSEKSDSELDNEKHPKSTPEINKKRRKSLRKTSEKSEYDDQEPTGKDSEKPEPEVKQRRKSESKTSLTENCNADSLNLEPSQVNSEVSDLENNAEDHTNSVEKKRRSNSIKRSTKPTSEDSGNTEFKRARRYSERSDKDHEELEVKQTQEVLCNELETENSKSTPEINKKRRKSAGRKTSENGTDKLGTAGKSPKKPDSEIRQRKTGKMDDYTNCPRNMVKKDLHNDFENIGHTELERPRRVSERSDSKNEEKNELKAKSTEKECKNHISEVGKAKVKTKRKIRDYFDLSGIYPIDNVSLSDSNQLNASKIELSPENKQYTFVLTKQSKSKTKEKNNKTKIDISSSNSTSKLDIQNQSDHKKKITNSNEKKSQKKQIFDENGHAKKLSQILLEQALDEETNSDSSPVKSTKTRLYHLYVEKNDASATEVNKKQAKIESFMVPRSEIKSYQDQFGTNSSSPNRNNAARPDLRRLSLSEEKERSAEKLRSTTLNLDHKLEPEDSDVTEDVRNNESQRRTRRNKTSRKDSVVTSNQDCCNGSEDVRNNKLPRGTRRKKSSKKDLEPKDSIVTLNHGSCNVTENESPSKTKRKKSSTKDLEPKDSIGTLNHGSCNVTENESPSKTKRKKSSRTDLEPKDFIKTSNHDSCNVAEDVRNNKSPSGTKRKKSSRKDLEPKDFIKTSNHDCCNATEDVKNNELRSVTRRNESSRKNEESMDYNVIPNHSFTDSTTQIEKIELVENGIGKLKSNQVSKPIKSDNDMELNSSTSIKDHEQLMAIEKVSGNRNLSLRKDPVDSDVIPKHNSRKSTIGAVRENLSHIIKERLHSDIVSDSYDEGYETVTAPSILQNKNECEISRQNFNKLLVSEKQKSSPLSHCTKQNKMKQATKSKDIIEREKTISDTISSKKETIQEGTPRGKAKRSSMKRKRLKTVEENIGSTPKTCFMRKKSLKSNETSSSKDLVEPSSSNDLVEPSSSNGLVEPSSSNGLVELSSSNDLVEPSSSNDLVEPSSSNGLVEPSSSNDLVEPSSSNGLVEPSSSYDLVEPSSSNGLVEPSSSNDLVEPSSSKMGEQDQDENIPSKKENALQDNTETMPLMPEDVGIGDTYSNSTKIPWSSEETEKFVLAVQKYGAGHWREIGDYLKTSRTNAQLRDKWRKLFSGYSKKELSLTKNEIKSSPEAQFSNRKILATDELSSLLRILETNKGYRSKVNVESIPETRMTNKRSLSEEYVDSPSKTSSSPKTIEASSSEENIQSSPKAWSSMKKRLKTNEVNPPKTHVDSSPKTPSSPSLNSKLQHQRTFSHLRKTWSSMKKRLKTHEVYLLKRHVDSSPKTLSSPRESLKTNEANTSNEYVQSCTKMKTRLRTKEVTSLMGVSVSEEYVEPSPKRVEKDKDKSICYKEDTFNEDTDDQENKNLQCSPTKQRTSQEHKTKTSQKKTEENTINDLPRRCLRSNTPTSVRRGKFVTPSRKEVAKSPTTSARTRSGESRDLERKTTETSISEKTKSLNTQNGDMKTTLQLKKTDTDIENSDLWEVISDASTDVREEMSPVCEDVLFRNTCPSTPRKPWNTMSEPSQSTASPAKQRANIKTPKSLKKGMTLRSRKI